MDAVKRNGFSRLRQTIVRGIDDIRNLIRHPVRFIVEVGSRKRFCLILKLVSFSGGGTSRGIVGRFLQWRQNEKAGLARRLLLGERLFEGVQRFLDLGFFRFRQLQFRVVERRLGIDGPVSPQEVRTKIANAAKVGKKVFMPSLSINYCCFFVVIATKQGYHYNCLIKMRMGES
ncbi:MAG: hypothetical protein C4523_17145 [Myxococcales bacterium]|nr:MAG: hypothetical protein C4523_17145 [Myxococcales bacterium]